MPEFFWNMKPKAIENISRILSEWAEQVLLSTFSTYIHMHLREIRWIMPSGLLLASQ